jgi:hypothetical protein
MAKKLLPPLKIKLLRAMMGGPITREQLIARLGVDPGGTLTALRKAGLIELGGSGSWISSYRITDAGRAALPPRNPASATRHINLPVMGENVSGPSHQRTGDRCQTSTHS